MRHMSIDKRPNTYVEKDKKTILYRNDRDINFGDNDKYYQISEFATLFKTICDPDRLCL